MKMCLACGRLFADSVIAMHYSACPEREDIRPAIIAKLQHPDHPGYALSHRDYDANQPPISSVTLRRRFGTWSQICAHFGLLPISTMPKPPKPVEGVDVPKRQHVALGKRLANRMNAPLEEWELHVCTRRGHDEFSGTDGLHSHWR